MRRNTFLAAIISVAILALFVLLAGSPTGMAAPLAAPTPVSIAHPSGPAPEYPIFFNAAVLTADTRSSCFEVPEYTIVDLQWIVDQTLIGVVPNTTTLTLQHSNGSTYVDGIAVATANIADVDGLDQFPIYGRHTCIYADVANTNPITVTAIGVVK